MKKIILLISSILFIKSAISQEENIESKIAEVVVFQNGAQITRTAQKSISSGRSILVFDNLPVSLNEESVMVSGEGDFMILSVVNQTVNENVEEVDQKKIQSLYIQINQLNDSIKYEKSKLDIYKSQISLLTKLDNKFDPQKEFSLTDFKEAMEFQNKKLIDIKSKEFKANSRIVIFQNEINETNLLVKKCEQQKTISKKQIVLTVSAKTNTTAVLKLTYYIGNAGWNSAYDIRVENISKPVELIHKANVYQNTGEDWENVLLTLSNGNPMQSGIKPTLNHWYIEYIAPNMSAKYSGIREDKLISGVIYDNEGKPLPGANILIEGTTIGTISDLNGKFSIRAPKGSKAIVLSFIGFSTKVVPLTASNFNIKLQYDKVGLDEVVVIGYGTAKKNNLNTKLSENVPVAKNDNQTTFEFKIDVPYTIPTGGKKHMVQIQAIRLPAQYQYYCVPKLDKDAFLIAKITNWEKNNLSGGEANLYFEGTYLGKSNLNLAGVKDTLYLSLGRDKNIKIERTMQKEQSKNQILANKKADEKVWNISVKNMKNQPISIMVEDQIPLSLVEEIKISLLELNNGLLDEESGKISWELNIKSQKEESISYKYVIKYPADYQINASE